MPVLGVAFTILIATSGGLLLLSWWAQLRLLTRPAPLEPPELPAVSILKPLCGADPQLEESLTTFFRLDYPRYEMLFGVADPADPALAVAHRVSDSHPEVAAGG